MKPQNVIIWAGMLASVLMTGAVATVVGPQTRSPGLPAALSYVAVVMGIAGPVAGHIVRRVMQQPQRFFVSYVLGEAGAMTAAVVWMLTGSTTALGGLVVATVGFASLYPGAPEDVS